MSDFLTRMAEGALARVIAAEAREGRDALLRRALDAPPGPRVRHEAGGFDLIAEVKPRSPAAGALAAGGTCTPAAAAAQARAYAAGGAAVISVLTEPTAFGGSLEHLAAVAAAVDVPVMRKDFVVDTYQCYEARAAGARGVLVIARLLGRDDLAGVIATAEDLDLFVLCECFDAADAAAVAPLAERPHVWVGLNCRNLTTLAVEPGRFAALAPGLPGAVRVAESGCDTPEAVARVAALGYDMALVGSALMRHGDPTALTAAMLAAGRAVREPQ